MASTKIINFSSLMSPDIRSSNGFARIQHFKVFPHRLVPQFSSEADETKSLFMTRFAYAPWLSGTAYAFFAYGVKFGGSLPAVYIKGTTTGDIVADAWGTPASNEGSAGARNTDCFLHYKQYLYGFHGGNQLWRYGDLRGSPTFTDGYQSITYTTVAQAVHHPSDDCAYFFADNKVYRLNNTTWDGLVLTLPDDLKIMSGNAMGNYLEIACAPKSGLGNSTSFIWDRDSSLSTVTERIDWGQGNLVHTGVLKGVLVAVIDYFTNSSYSHNAGKVIIKPAGNEWEPRIFDVEGTDANNFTGNKCIVDDKLHFPLRITRGGQTLEGIWSVDSHGNVDIPISEEEVTTGRIQGIVKTGEYWWIAHSNDGSVNRTNDQTAYAYTSILETNVRGSADQGQFKGALVPFEPLPSGASVKLYCRKVGTASWGAAMKTVTTTGATALIVTHDGSKQAPVFNELQFRIEATGGAVITASAERPIEFMYEPNSIKPYG